MSKNEIIVSGYKGKFQHFFSNSNKKSVLYFQISQKMKNGKYENHDCVAFGEMAEKIEAIPQGTGMKITGYLSSRMVEKDGSKNKDVKVSVISYDTEAKFTSGASLSGKKGKYQNYFSEDGKTSVLYFQVVQVTKNGFQNHDCVAFGNTADTLQSVEAGTVINISGYLSSRMVEKNGSKKKDTKVIANTFTLGAETTTTVSDTSDTPDTSDTTESEDYYTSADDDFVDVDEDFELPFN